MVGVGLQVVDGRRGLVCDESLTLPLQLYDLAQYVKLNDDFHFYFCCKDQKIEGNGQFRKTQIHFQQDQSYILS